MKLGFQILLVAIGSALGGLARWGVTLLAARWLGTSFPWGTFIINISGCLFLGWFSTMISTHLAHNSGPWMKPDDLRLMIAVGFTGAYTTFSTFEVEAHGLLEHGHSTTGITYLLASLLVGLLAVRLGAMLAS